MTNDQRVGRCLRQPGLRPRRLDRGQPDLHAALEYIAAGQGFGGSVSLDITDLDIL